MEPKALVLTGYGINTDYETELALELAGAEAERVHLNDLLADKRRLRDYQILALPGGFSFGDDIAAGKVLASKLKLNLLDELLKFIARGNLVIGICNGFQVLIKMGLLPGLDGHHQLATLTYNDSGRFEDRWVYLKVNQDSKCVFTEGLEMLYLPIRNAEGKFVAPPEVLERLKAEEQVVLRYVDEEGREAGYPWNPSGSMENIAGICDPTGRVFGLMPHPEAFLFRVNHPRWQREALPEEGQGLAIFRNAVEYFS